MASRASVGLAALADDAGGGDRKYVHVMNIGVSVMLLGSVAFMMGLFYLTNQTCKKKATDSWKVISATISIFSAVLLFQGVNSIVEAEFLPPGSSKPFILVVSFTHLVAWLLFLQVFLAWISGALASRDGTRALTEEEESKFLQTKLNVECFAVLLGHITGFASIHAFATLQGMLPMKPIYKLLVMPMNWVSIFSLGQLFDQVREYISRADDGVKDPFEELWDRMAEETEDDIIGLTASFLIVQSFRFWLTGNMPNAEGDESDAQVQGYSNWEVACLVGAAFAVCALEAWRLVAIHKTWERFTPQLQNVTAMFMSWNLFFGANWFAGINFPHLHGMLKHVAIALGLTSVSTGLIFALDSLEEKIKISFKRRSAAVASQSTSSLSRMTTLARVQKEFDSKHIVGFIESCLTALSILIGFSWEKSFDFAVDAVTEAAEGVPPHVTKLLMALVLASVVVPAWRLHILPHIEEMEEALDKEEEEADESDEEERGGEVCDPSAKGRASCSRRSSSSSCRPKSAKAIFEAARRASGGSSTAAGRSSCRALGDGAAAAVLGEERGAPGGGGGAAGAPVPAAQATDADGGLRTPLLAGGEAAAHRQARRAELARLKAEKDGELDAIVARLAVFEEALSQTDGDPGAVVAQGG